MDGVLNIRVVTLGIVALAYCFQFPSEIDPAAASFPAAYDGQIAQGAYLAKIGGCAACHTAPDGGAPFAGGRGVPSPLGKIYSTNITSDPAHGIGSYSFGEFERAMREGITAGGRRLYPAMPYTAYAKVSDEDMRALYRYLQKGVPPAATDPTPTKLAFPFNQRWMLRWWNLAFAPRGVYEVKPEHDQRWNRGAYLTQGIGHCGACHTPRGPAFQERGYDEKSQHFLSGEVNDHWFGANLTNEPGAGLGRVSSGQIASLLRSGQADGLAVHGSMTEEVELVLQYLSADDASAIAAYLKTLPGQRGATAFLPDAGAAWSLADGNHTGDLESVGSAAYRGFCAGCHQSDGQGILGIFPRLAGNPSVLAQDASGLVRLVAEGGRVPKTMHNTSSASMPAFSETLTDVQQAQVLSYVRSAWGNSAPPVTTAQVSEIRRAIAK